ncbi:transglutaminase family protein [Roseomonas xinghualingensis]|uniref:transglutaminase family protein n=1 Tax=Roseomonas xinghualingensis TaxID=2986475 RepID=UPI0021F0B24A|nr:transglutaminase family protein [Roseomonas sp. SXEYE001]MCV4208148.1 transglutaminase family protein [Roseomonas sp. SXEYE001]
MVRAVTLTHVTTYRYDRPVFLGPQTIRLSPAPHAAARILRHALVVEPGNHSLFHRRDPQGNPEARAVFDGKVEHFTITAMLEAELQPVNPFSFVLEDGAHRWPFAYHPLLAAELGPNLRTGPLSPGVSALLPPRGLEADTLPTLLDLARRVAAQISYIRRDEPGIWEPEVVIARGEGSCRDSAWLLVHAFRAMGIAARFCSGYLLDTDERTAELHAWAEAFLPGAGWVGFDPTSGLLAAEFHLPLSAASDPRLAAPVSGTHEVCGVTFSAALTLEVA